MQNKKYLVIIIAILLASLLLLLVLTRQKNKKPSLEIYLDGKLYQRVFNIKEIEQQEIEIKQGSYYNLITISKGEVRVKEANCPRQLCVQQGAIKNSNFPLICLPHRLEIVIVDSTAPYEEVAR